MATAAQHSLGPDPAAIETFLTHYVGDAVQLTSIHPETGAIKTYWFGTAYGRARQWAADENRAGKNLYWTGNICRPGLNKKPFGGRDDPANMGDMVGQRIGHADLDAPKDGSAWDLDATLARLAAMRYPPSFAVFTGGGVQPIWRLEEIVRAKATVTDLNKGLEDYLDGDRCHNHDRLLRLPGTVNWPDDGKRKRGRVPTLAYIVLEDDGVVYPLAALAAEYRPDPEKEKARSRGAPVDVGEFTFLTADDLKLTTLHPLRKLIDSPKGEDRSRDTYACAGYMVRHRFTDAQILGVLRNPANAVSAHIMGEKDQARAARKCIEGTRKDLHQQASGQKAATGAIAMTDFYAYMPMHNYIFVPTRETWPAASVNSRLPDVPVVDSAGLPVVDENGKPVKLRPSQWIDEHRHVEQMTWVPGEPMHIENRLLADGGWIQQEGASCFNLYRAPTIVKGISAEAGRWIDHIHHVYPEEAEHLIKWFAHRVQRPGEKINHAIVLGGNQGVGKDTLLEPVKYAVGPWNFVEVSPQHLLGRFNGFVKSVILRVSEARDLGDVDRFAFYDHMKTYTAAPPDVLRVDEKNLREYVVPNVQGVVITTNHKADGIYLPADDRRHYVAWSDRIRDDFSLTYWTELYEWFGAEGNRHVAAHLAELDLSAFNAKAPPPKTNAFWSIVDASRAPEDAELADALEKMMHPKATTLARIAECASEDFAIYLLDRRNARKIPHRLEECGYVSVRNPSAQDGLWKVNGRRCAIYGQRALSLRDALEAAERIASARTGNPRF